MQGKRRPISEGFSGRRPRANCVQHAKSSDDQGKTRGFYVRLSGLACFTSADLVSFGALAAAFSVAAVIQRSVQWAWLVFLLAREVPAADVAGF
jgi:hypothetical protein